MNFINKPLSVGTTLILSAFVVTAQEVEKVEVDVNTPDHVLLKGKDTAEMYEVAEPSSALTITVDSLENPIEVVSAGDEPAAIVEDASKEELQAASEILGQVIGEDAEDVKVTVEKESSASKYK